MLELNKKEEILYIDFKNKQKKNLKNYQKNGKNI